jgi:hypothetical protein
MLLSSRDADSGRTTMRTSERKIGREKDRERVRERERKQRILTLIKYD